MKANELRIGNLLTFNGKIRTVDGVSLVGCHKDERYILVELNYMYKEKVLLQIDKIDPTPLTEEWLLRFGFEKVGVNYQKGWLLLWTFLKTGEVHFVLNEPNSNKRHITEFKYVHQLQNLYFALTGEELEIKL